MNTPLVSIIIPTYNRAHLINDTLNSILMQTYTHWECIIVDDGSTDITEVLVQEYSNKDARFRYYKRPDSLPKGANACRNYGFIHSKGQYINWFDSDDVMAPNKLELQLKALEEHSNAPFCICQTKWINKGDNTFLGLRAKQISSENRFEDYILFKIFWSILAPLWRRDFLENNQLCFDEDLQQSQEYDFHIKALAINSNYIVVNEALASMYKHEDNISNNIYSNVGKVESNIKVKLRILQTYSDRLSENTKLKIVEMLTLMYKDVLLLRDFRLAKKLQRSLFTALKYLMISPLRKSIFQFKLRFTYFSYRIFGKGYSLVKPLK